MSRFWDLPVLLVAGIVALSIAVAGGIITLILESQVPCCGLNGLLSFLYFLFVGPVISIVGIVFTVIGLIRWAAVRKGQGGV